MAEFGGETSTIVLLVMASPLLVISYLLLVNSVIYKLQVGSWAGRWRPILQSAKNVGDKYLHCWLAD